MEAAAHVLRDFDASERAELPTLFEHAARAIETFVGEGIARAMNKHNGSIRSNPP
jgi:peptidyl-tRNA hydrolase